MLWYRSRVLVGNGDVTIQWPVGVSLGSTDTSFAIGLLIRDGLSRYCGRRLLRELKLIARPTSQ